MTKAAMIYALIVTAILVITVIVFSFMMNKKEGDYHKMVEEIKEDFNFKISELEKKEEKKDKLKREYDKKKERANTGNRADDVANTVNELQKLSGKKRVSVE